MRFAYTYRYSDGQRHTAEIEAESRDAAFAKVRAELGIKPIKVTVVEASRQDGGSPYGRAGARPSRGGMLWGAAILAASILALLAFGIWRWAGARDARPYQVMTPQGPVTYSVAAPLPRQAIPGDRRRIEQAVAQERDPPVFAHAAERWLARYAEPGRGAQAGPGAGNGLFADGVCLAPDPAGDHPGAARRRRRLPAPVRRRGCPLRRPRAHLRPGSFRRRHRRQNPRRGGGGCLSYAVVNVLKTGRQGDTSYRQISRIGAASGSSPVIRA